MIALSLFRLTLVFVGFVTYKLVKRFYLKRKFRQFSKANHCEDAIDLSGDFPYGLKRINDIRTCRQTGRDVLDDILGHEFQFANTFQMTMIEGSNIITTAEPKNIQAMLATQFSDYETGKMRHNQFWPVLGRSIFSSDGPFWEHSRALLRPQFIRDNINDLEETDRASGLLIQAIGAINADGWSSAVDLSPLIFNFTLDTSTAFLFGTSVDSQTALMKRNGIITDTSATAAAEDATSAEFLNAFATASDYTLYRLRLQSLYWLADGIKFRKAAAHLHKFTTDAVRLALDTNPNEKSAIGEKSKNLLHALATQTKDREELRAQATAVLFAGRDTTAALICWCFLRLAQHPDIYARLRNTILTTFPPGEPITFSQLKSCRSLQHFINEVFRLHPAIPFNNRIANKDTTLPTGGGADGRSPIAIPKGQTIAFSLYHMHRRVDLWGDDAAEFKPERWEQKIPAWQYLPFSGGPRICIGQQYSLIETSYLLVKVLMQFDRIEPVGWTDTNKVKKGMGLTMWPRLGVHVRLHRASQ